MPQTARNVSFGGEKVKNIPERLMKAVEGVICSDYRIIRPESRQPASGLDEAAQGSMQAGSLAVGDQP